MKNLCISIFMMLYLSACNPFMGYAPTSESIVTKNWALNERRQPMVKIYCYPTLGENKCVEEPLEGKDHLLIGAYVIGEEDYKKKWWEKMSLDRTSGISANRIRKELALPEIPQNPTTCTK